MKWVFEPDTFNDNDVPLMNAVRKAGHQVLLWPTDVEGPYVFRGSLNVAAAQAVFCDIKRLSWHSWAPAFGKLLLNANYTYATVATAHEVARTLAAPRVFIRPDSPLKPFSGRVLNTKDITPNLLDLGYFYDDPNLQVVIAPAQPIEAEWRCIMVDDICWAVSRYEPTLHRAISGPVPYRAAHFAETAALCQHEAGTVYVMDICQSRNRLFVLELNAFAGAELYASDGLSSLVEAVSRVRTKTST